MTAVLTPIQSRLRVTSRAWRLEDLDGCCVLKLPPHIVDVLERIRSSVFDSNMLPKAWAMDYSNTSGVFRSQDVNTTGRLEFRFPESTDLDIECHMNRVRGTVVHLLRLCGVGLEEQDNYSITDSFIHVALQRCRRLPFLHTGHALSGPFEDVYLVYPLCKGRPIALWNMSLPLFRDGSPPTWIPVLTGGEVMVFTQHSFSLLSTTHCVEGLYSNAFIVIRVSSKSGYNGSHPESRYHENEHAETFLRSSTAQPSVMNCVVCMGPIRERRHGLLGGPRDQQNLQCSLFHCVTCRNTNPFGNFYLCEFCVRSKLSPFQNQNAHVMSQGDLTIASTSTFVQYFSSAIGCRHDTFGRNDLVDTLFLLIRPNELIAGAIVFLDFYLNSTWHEGFAPELLQDTFDAGKMQELWPTFYQCFVQNSQCPRVRMTCYAIQCAMNTGPVMRRQGTRVPTYARELFLSGDLRSSYNKHGIDKCIYPRVLNAADFARGLFTFDILKVMAIRIFKLLGDDTKFSPSYACCCSNPSTMEGSHNSVSCRGPVLDLSQDLGQPHHWSKQSNPKRSNFSSRNRQVIKQHQAELRLLIQKRDFDFQNGVHYPLPGTHSKRT